MENTFSVCTLTTRTNERLLFVRFFFHSPRSNIIRQNFNYQQLFLFYLFQCRWAKTNKLTENIANFSFWQQFSDEDFSLAKAENFHFRKLCSWAREILLPKRYIHKNTAQFILIILWERCDFAFIKARILS